MVVVKRDDTELEYDLSKIADAIYDAFMPFDDLMFEIENRIQEIWQAIYDNFVRFFSSDYSIRLKKKAICFLINPVQLQIPNLKHMENAFLENSGKVRKMYLLSKHHRGTTDDFNANDERNPKMAF